MDKLDATSRVGSLVDIAIDRVPMRAYIPVDLPFDPPINFGPTAQRLMQEAYHALGQLDGAASSLPDRHLLLYMYLRKEAVLSSQIEGTQSSLEGFLRHEEEAAPGVPRDEILEISNYVSAIELGVETVAQEGITLDLLLRLHEMLLASGRGSDKQPGQLRERQNLVGTKNRVVFVPPPPQHVAPKLRNLITFMRDTPMPAGVLPISAVAHVQFETIHPFMDGNGRIGRMLITLLLCQTGVLKSPLLFISLYLKEHRGDYYQLLTDVREHGDWEGWLNFFLTAIRDTSRAAAESARAVSELLSKDRQQVIDLGRLAGSALQVYEHLLKRPLTDVHATSNATSLSQPTVRASLKQLIEIGLCSEVTGGLRNRLYRYDDYLDILNSGTEV